MADKIRKVYLGYVFLFEFFMCFIVSTYVLYLAEHNFDKFEINIVNIVFMGTIFLLELPTGLIADFFGRKNSLLCTQFFFCLAGVVYYSSNSMTGFLVAEFLAAIGATCRSGALDAWIKDTLAYYGSKESSQSIFSNEGKYDNLGRIAGGLIGGFVGYYSKGVPWLLLGIGHGLLFFYLLILMPEPYFKSKKTSLKNAFCELKNMITSSMRFCFKNREVKLLIFLEITFGFCMCELNMLWTLYYISWLNVYQIGFLWILMSCGLLLGSIGAKYTENIKNKSKLFLLCFIPTGIFMIFATCIQYVILSMIFFAAHEIGRGMYKPVKKSVLQDAVEKDEIRATIGSVLSQFSGFGYMSGLIVMGLFARYVHNYVYKYLGYLQIVNENISGITSPEIYNYIVNDFAIKIVWLVTSALLIVNGTVYYFIARTSKK